MELDFTIGDYRFVLINAHLKSRRAIPGADQAEMRRQEALILRNKIDQALSRVRGRNVIVVGDLNDTPDTPVVQIVQGKGPDRLVDIRPFEPNGDHYSLEGNKSPRRIYWTHYFSKDDSYTRADYLMCSKPMARELKREECYILAFPDWGEASDHRPIVATFIARDQ